MLLVLIHTSSHFSVSFGHSVANDFLRGAGAWVMEDQYEHDDTPNLADSLKNGRDDLLAKLVWTTGTGVTAVWSRRVATGDIADHDIVNSM